jgi:hypothetical protein
MASHRTTAGCGPQPPTVVSWHDRRDGEGGIRTHETLTGLPVFETGSFNRSDTSPDSPCIIGGPVLTFHPEYRLPIAHSARLVH